MSTIITGASGFVGRNLVQYLNDMGLETTAVSLRDKNWTALVPNEGTAIIHLAGKAHDTANSSSPETYFAINRDLTIALFDHFLLSNIRDFYFFSSVKAVADTLGHGLTEEDLASPRTPYGKSKREAEEYLLSKTLPNGKRLFIVRPSMIHGPGNKGNLNLLFNIVNKGLPWPLGDFKNQRSFLSIDNLCYLVERMLIKENVPSGIYNFADDSTFSTNELVRLIAKNLDKNVMIWSIPKELVKILVKIGDVLPLPLNSERLKKLTESYVVSNTKIKQALDIEILPYTLESGLNKTIKSFVADV